MFPKKKLFSTSRIKYQLLSCYIVQKFLKNVLTFHMISWILFIRRRPNSQSREQPYMLLILYCQYHAWWCPGSLGRQGISRHGIDEISWNIPSLASEEFICLTKFSPAVNATTTVPFFFFSTSTRSNRVCDVLWLADPHWPSGDSGRMNSSGGAYIDGLAQDCSNSSALAMELLQSCTKPSI